MNHRALDILYWPPQVVLWVAMVHVCVGTAACPGTADFSPCAPQAKITDSYPFKNKTRSYRVNFGTF